ncbi:MAG: hypothetical protein OXM61_00130 [Candidatus Poribacteria bacterium]|nr:hypothetical protein [Candidatus Poribacteria bacterium]
MHKKFFVFTLFILFTVVTIVLHSGRTHEAYPGDDSLPSSEYADVHGEVFGGFGGHDTRVHVHGIAYANGDRDGNYTVLLTASGVDPAFAQGSFDVETRRERDLTFSTGDIDRVAMGWTASSTVRIKKENGKMEIHNDYDEKEADEIGENDDWKDGQGNADPEPGLSPDNGSYVASPGDSHQANLITDAPYNSVYWYVRGPGESSNSLGSNIDTTYGDDEATSTEDSFTYTFPSGAMHTGEYVITAYIYLADQSVDQEHYTVTVQ